MAEPMRVELTGPLAGRHVLVERRRLTGGFVEDVQSGDAKLILDAVSRAVVGGDLPDGTDRAALRELPLDELNVVLEAVVGCLSVPKR